MYKTRTILAFSSNQHPPNSYQKKKKLFWENMTYLQVSC